MNIEVGSVVAFNNLEDATWFTVIATDDFILTVRESGTDYAAQRIDKCAVKKVRNRVGQLQGEYRGFHIYARMGWYEAYDAFNKIVARSSYHAGVQTEIDKLTDGGEA